MKKIATIWLFVLFGLTLTVSLAFAEPPKKEGVTWKKATVVSVNPPQARLTATEGEDQEIVVPDVWFGGWGEDSGKYYLGFYAEEINSKYQVVYGVKKDRPALKIGITFL